MNYDENIGKTVLGVEENKNMFLLHEIDKARNDSKIKKIKLTVDPNMRLSKIYDGILYVQFCKKDIADEQLNEIQELIKKINQQKEYQAEQEQKKEQDKPKEEQLKIEEEEVIPKSNNLENDEPKKEEENTNPYKVDYVVCYDQAKNPDMKSNVMGNWLILCLPKDRMEAAQKMTRDIYYCNGEEKRAKICQIVEEFYYNFNFKLFEPKNDEDMER